jgi:hypothetical protein
MSECVQLMELARENRQKSAPSASCWRKSLSRVAFGQFRLPKSGIEHEFVGA